MKAKYTVEKALVLGQWNGDWMITYYCDGRIDYDVHGTKGLGCKLFNSYEKAVNSGKRYLKKMKENGFHI